MNGSDVEKLAEPNATDDFVVVNRSQLQELIYRKSSVVVGAYRITQLDDGTVWIGERDGGEGGQFKNFEECLDEFYRRHF